jgi:hypothetical protein
MWSGYDDWPVGDVAKVRPNKCPTAAIWAARLDPAPKRSRTVLEQSLLTSIGPHYHRSELLQDPKTGLPAIYCENSSEGAYVATLSPHWLPTLDPLTSVIFSDYNVWITTEDEGLWIAPERTSPGLSWGPKGGKGGSMTVANLLNRLVDDITSPAIEGYPMPTSSGYGLRISCTCGGTSTVMRFQARAANAS